MIILGLDPGLGTTGWGVILKDASRLAHIGNGQIKTNVKASLAERLALLDRELTDVLTRYEPQAAAVEEIFVNNNPQSTLKLAHARGVSLLNCARAGLAVQAYFPRVVKKSLTGTGTATKEQVQAMLKRLLPRAVLAGSDAADALAVAITHAHHQ